MCIFSQVSKRRRNKKRWLNIISGNITQHSVLCGLHFKFEDFTTHPAAARKSLKLNAILSIFPVIILENKKVHVLSSITISQEMPPTPGTSSVPPSKKIKLQQNAKTQTSITFNTSRKNKLHREIKILSQKLKRRNETIKSEIIADYY
ncbi:unnamed protein product [Parnassius mnemosyne]|uniref:THAP-type domain-containing protein n=1 Tax=Parnassius mnemosyne TaxID=213953 RepID=A0AAV1M1I7_9NEOP